MNFFHYKDYPPINLAKVGTLGKENQQVAQGSYIYTIAFYEFERKLGLWVFQSQQERDQVFKMLLKIVSKDLAATSARASHQLQPAKI